MFPCSKYMATACAAALLVCTGCALQAPKPPLPDVPAAFENGAPGGQADWPSKDWYRGFKSRELDALIAQATMANLDLAAARARLTQADARARQAGAALLPSVDATANGNYFAGHSANGSAHEFDWSALLSASYEIDFWGKNRATANAGRYLSAAARGDRDTIALTTLAGVADGYFEVLSLRERSKIAQSNLAASRGLLEVVQARFHSRRGGPGGARHATVGACRGATGLPELQAARGGGLNGTRTVARSSAGRIPGGGGLAGFARRAAGGPGAAGRAAHPAPRRVHGGGQSARRGCRPGRGARRPAAELDSDAGGRHSKPRDERRRHRTARRRPGRESRRGTHAKHIRWRTVARGAR